MKLEDSIHINAPAERTFCFFDELDHNTYLAWYPDHKKLEWRQGRGRKTGNIVFFEEIIYGRLKKMSVVYTRIITDAFIEFTPTNWFFRLLMPRMTFIFEPQKQGFVFTAQVFIRI